MKEFWYDYVKPKHGKNGKFCYMDRALLFVAHAEIEDIYKDIAEDVETRFNISNFE